MNILFINPSLRPDAKRRQLPVGLAYIMTAVKKAGFTFDLIDMDINRLSPTHLPGLLKDKSYDVCALGCIVTGYRYVKNIASVMKDIFPNIIIVAGNSVATSIPEILLKSTSVDIAVLGEGDVTIVELLDSIRKGEDVSQVKGLAVRQDGRVIFTGKRTTISVLDDVGFPDWNLFDLQQYVDYAAINVNAFSTENVLSYPLNSARGCPFDCTFCYHVFKEDKYRRYSELSILKEIERLHEKYDCNFISFWDELTFPSIKAVRNRINSLENLAFKINWDAPVRANLFKRQHLEILKELKLVGCDNLAFSLENASPIILSAMNKRINVGDFIEQAHCLWDAGIIPLTSIVLGYPQETPETIRETIDVCRECRIFPSTGFLLPLPGTPIYTWAMRNGFIGDEVEYLERIGDRQDFHINLTAMPDDKFVGIVTDELHSLADDLGIKVESVFKTTTYQTPGA